MIAGSNRGGTGLPNPNDRLKMIAGSGKYTTGLPNLDESYSEAMMMTQLSAAQLAYAERKHPGLLNPIELCIDGGPDPNYEGQSRKDLKTPRLSQRLLEHPEESRMHPGGEASPIECKMLPGDVRGQL